MLTALRIPKCLLFVRGDLFRNKTYLRIHTHDLLTLLRHLSPVWFMMHSC